MNSKLLNGDKKYLQRVLRIAGYYHGRIDGIIGAQSKAAINAWDADEQEGKRLFGMLDDRSEQNLTTLLPVCQTAVRKWMQEKVLPWAKVSNLSVKIIQGTRTWAEQDALYAQGRTTPGQRVTNARGGSSLHNYCIALDLGLFSGKSYLTSDTKYKELYKACGAPQGFEWGGNWKSIVDTPHYQYAKFGSTSSAIKAKFN